VEVSTWRNAAAYPAWRARTAVPFAKHARRRRWCAWSALGWGCTGASFRVDQRRRDQRRGRGRRPVLPAQLPDRESAQASSISASEAQRWDEDGTPHGVLLVSNGSDAPVYELSVRIPGRCSPAWLDPVPPKTTSEQRCRWTPGAIQAMFGVIPRDDLQVRAIHGVCPAGARRGTTSRDGVSGRRWSALEAGQARAVGPPRIRKIMLTDARWDDQWSPTSTDTARR
jgi:hypothetical protein